MQRWGSRVSRIPGKHSTSELHSQPQIVFFKIVHFNHMTLPIYLTILGSCMLCSFLIGWYYKQDCVQHLLSSVFQKTGPKLDPEHRVSSLGTKETRVQVPGCYWPSSLNLAIQTITVSVSPFISPPPQFPHVNTDLTARVISSVAIRAERVKGKVLTYCMLGLKSSVNVAPLTFIFVFTSNYFLRKNS